LQEFSRVKLPAVILVLLSLWALYMLFASPRFQVNRVVIEGARIVQPADVQRVVDVVGKSVFRVQARQLEARLQSEFGCIKQATVACRLPNQVFVTIQEHEAVLIWESGGRSWWIDVEGNILGAAPTSGDLLVLHDIRKPRPIHKGMCWASPPSLRATWAGAARRAFVDYTREEGLIVYAAPKGWPVYLGHNGDARTKAALMQALVQQLVAKKADVVYIDLRHEQRPIVKQR
jgi:cell division septal protein FtsQ